MTDRLTIRAWEPVQARRAVMTQLWPTLKAMLIAGHRMVIELRPEPRSTAQNAKLHAMLSDIARQVEWAGKRRDVEAWKRLIVAAWCRAEGEAVEFLPAIDGKGVDIVFRRTSEMTRAEVASLIEYAYAWGIEAGVVFNEPERVDPETGEILSRERVAG